MGRTFQRARRPEQKAEQHEHLLDAARRFLSRAHHSSELSLADVANLAGMVRSNVYRYFQSREAILLALLVAELEDWTEDVASRLQCAEGGTDTRLEALAEAMDEATAARPLLCHLVSVLPGLLDTARPRSGEAPFAGGEELRARLTATMHRAVPELTEAQHSDLLRHVASFVIGVYPLSPSASDSGTSLADRRKPTFQRELRKAVLVVARGILGERAGS